MNAHFRGNNDNVTMNSTTVQDPLIEAVSNDIQIDASFIMLVICNKITMDTPGRI